MKRAKLLGSDSRVSSTFQFTEILSMSETKAAEVFGMKIRKSERTMCEWTSKILKYKQGRYQQSGVLCTS